MNILNWEPVITCRAISHRTLIDECLKFEAQIRCPCCKKEDKIDTGGHLDFSEDLVRNIGWEINALTKARECQFCGTVFSPIPATFRKGFSEGAYARVTQGWVTAELTKLKEQEKRGRALTT